MNNPLNENICPLCQQANLCAVDDDRPCWCVSTNVPKALLARVPSRYQAKACICRDCIAAFNADKVVEKS